MPMRTQSDEGREQPSDPQLVARNLVFGTDTDELPDITADLLAEAMARRGFETSKGEAASWLHERYASELPRWRDGQHVVA